MTNPIQILAALRRDCEATSLSEHRLRTARPHPRTQTVGMVGKDVPDITRRTLLERHATRYFEDEPIDPDLIGSMVGAGHAVDAALWPGEHAEAPLDFYVAARAVSGLQAAIYAVTTEGLERAADLPTGDGLEEMVLQPEFAQAPALLLAFGSLETGLDRHGSHGHRLLLERSGSACEAAWLTAVEHGYSGSIFAGFLPAALRALVGIDGFRRTQLLALAVGRARAGFAEQAGVGPAD